ncbi:MAG: CHASE2 domain-containing protein [Pyrinomonadaceae bacterium]
MSNDKWKMIRSTALILLASMSLVALVVWFAPSLSAAATNVLFRLRGELKASDDILILAIDDQSLQRIGRWPWPRSVMAEALDKISQARPQAVGLDIVYAEPSAEGDDKRLAEAVRNNGRVVLPAQLIAAEGKEIDRSGSIVWLRPVLGSAATAVGHAHVSPDVDGILRAIQLSKSDDAGTRLWAFGLEVVRVAEKIPAEDFGEDKAGELRFGQYQIPLREEEPAGSAIPGVKVMRSNEMLINYAGPPASFRRYSIADVLSGQVPIEVFADKIVLVGAVAPSMGDSRVSPFMHYGANERQAGQEMPGVEVHANIINTIRQRLWLRHVPESYAFLISLGIIFLTALVVSRLDGWRQVAGLGAILLAILCGSFFAFKHLLVIPPLPGMLAGFAASIPLLLNRTLNTSRRLDLKLEALAHTQKGFLLEDASDVSTKEERSMWLDLPRDLAWKLRAVDSITTRLLARMNFMDRVLSGMGEGVLVADTAGRIVFANREAAQVFDSSPEKLSAENFADCFIEREVFDEAELSLALKEASLGRIFHKEFTIQAADARRHYSLNLSAISTRSGADNAARPESPVLSTVNPETPVIGIVALITDTTRRVELDQIRMETLQLVSHELRTPLTSIQGLSDVLLKFPVETDEAREMLTTIHAEAVRLSETINRYLDIARLESGMQALRITNVDVEQLIAGCISVHAPIGAQRGIKIAESVSRPLPPLAVDTQLLPQAVNNLLSNAMKYSAANSEVTVEAESDGTCVFIRVSDQGPGIPADERERIFEKFYRLERDAALGIIGTGLGLPLVQEIVEKHGGRVYLESSPGIGSTFTIALPVESSARLNQK